MTSVESEIIRHSHPETTQIQVTSRHFLVLTCSHCNKIMELVEGDVIYGDKWFHSSCWNLTKNGESKNV